MRPRLRKVMADVWSNRTRSLLVIASVTVGLFAVGVIATLYTVMTSDLRSGYAAVNPPNIRIVAMPFDKDVLDRLTKLDGVRQVEGGREFSLRLESVPERWIAIDLHAASDEAPRQIGRLQIVDGKYPAGEHEIVIEQYKAADTGAQIGDLLTLELPSGMTRELKLVGIVADQTVGAFNGGPGFFLAPVQGYIDKETLEWLEQPRPDYFNVAYLTAEDGGDGEARLKQLAFEAGKEIEAAGGQTINLAVRTTYDHPNRQYVEALSVILLMLGGLVLFLSGFLIFNTIQALIRQQLTQIGILKTLGGRRIQVMLLYMTLILIFGAAAAALAVPAAYRTAFSRIVPLALIINMDFRGPRFLPEVIALQILMALLTPQISALLPIWQGARISVQEALSGIRQTGSPHGKLRRKTLRQRPARLRGVSRPTLISIRNTFRHKGRLALTLLTLSLGGAIFIATFNVRVTMDSYVDLVSRYFLADVNLTLAESQRIDEVIRIVNDTPGVAYSEAWGSARSEMILPDGSSGENVSLLAPPADSRLLDPVLIEGRWVTPDDERAIVLNERFQIDYPGLQVGDRLNLNVNGEETEWTVVGFFQLAGRSSGLIAYTGLDALGRATGFPNQSQVYRVLAENSMKTKDEQEALGRAIENRLNQRGIRLADMTTGSHLSNSAAQGFSALTGFLLFLAILTALVGSIGLAGTMSLNVLDRTREIGILRAIGATDAVLRRLVLVEALIIGLMSWLLATLLSFPMSKLLSDSVGMAIFGNPTKLTFTPTGFLLWLAAVTLLSILAALLPARSAARLTIREVLAYE